MDFNAFFVRFTDAVSEGIIALRFPHGARDPVAEGLDFGIVSGIGIGAHLEDDGVEFILRRSVDDGA